jgi:hypothetical protein
MKGLIPGILLILAVVVWVFSVAASATYWYYYNITVTVVGIEISSDTKYYLTESKSSSCASGSCATVTYSYDDSNSSSEWIRVQTTTRALLIVGIIVQSFLVVYLIALLLASFILKIEGAFKLKSQLLWIIGLVLSVLSTVLLTLSWLSYFGITQATNDDLNGLTVIF